MAQALLASGKHTVTAVTRHDSTTPQPEGTVVKKVNYEDPETIISALRGQDALVIVLSGRTDTVGIHKKLFAAASEAGVRWVMPSEWGFDTENQGLIDDIVISKHNVQTREHLKQEPKLSFIAMSTGFWYEFSLAIAPAYGIDINDRTATLFDDGTTKISTSTWPQVGRAVASLLSLPITRPSASSGGACLTDFRNQLIYISSFFVSQRDMLASLYRVTDTQEADWTITSEPSRQRYHENAEKMKAGGGGGGIDYMAFVKTMYTRVFWDDQSGDVEAKVVNEQLGLPKEDLDEATGWAVQRAKEGKW